MELEPFIEAARRELEIAVGSDDDTQAVAERMALALTPTIRLMLLNALAAAAEDISLELAPGSVEVRLRGGEPSFVVELPPSSGPEQPAAVEEPSGATAALGDAEDGPMTRINLRLSEQLKARVEAAAEAEGRSANAWLVRAAATVLDGRDARPGRTGFTGPTRFTGWVR